MKNYFLTCRDISEFPEIDLVHAKDLIEKNNFHVNQLSTFKTADYRIPEVRNVTLLYAAITNGDEELVDYLLSKNADVDIPVSDNSCNAVHNAIRQGKLNILKKLVDHGANLEHSIEPHNHRPLHTAIEIKNYDIIKYLIDVGVAVTDVFKSTVGRPLDWIFCGNFRDIITLLHENGADFLQYKTPLGLYSSMLSEVAHYGFNRKMKPLFDLDANVYPTYVNERNGKTYPILYRSVQSYHLKQLVLLLEYYKFEPAYINIVLKNNRSMLHVAICQELLKHPNMVINRNRRVYKIMVKNCNLVVNHLLNAGIDVNILDNNDKLAIDYIDDDNADLILQVKKHIIKLLAVDRYVCQRNIAAVSGTKFNNFHIQCRQEVKKMAGTLIGTSNLSYYRLLRLSTHESAMYLKNVNLSEVISSDFYNTRKKTSSEMFPLYGGLIYYRLIRVPKRIELLKKIEGVVESIFYPIIPYTCIRLIYCYLTNEDLKKLSENLNY